MTCPCCRPWCQADVTIATLRMPAVFGPKQEDSIVVRVGPIQSLPSGVVQVDFNPQPPHDGQVCRFPLLHDWCKIQSVTAHSPRSRKTITYGPEAFRCGKTGRLNVNTCDLEELMYSEVCPVDGVIYFTFTVPTA